MNWKAKASIMRLCACMPFGVGAEIYKAGQKRVGRLGARRCFYNGPRNLDSMLSYTRV